MIWWQAILLGVVQGVTEFLPISSSGHLILVSKLFNLPDQGLAVDATLHIATAVAILLYFYPEWVRIIRNWRKDPTLKKIIVASVPAALVGLTFGDAIENALRSPLVVAVMLVAVAALMWWAESNYTEIKQVSTTSKKSPHVITVEWSDALIIGAAQVLALIPGTSRSGITMVTGMLRRVTREQAAKFAFLLGVPVTLGGGLTKLPELINSPNTDWNFIGIAALTTLAVAMITIHWFLKHLSSITLKPFAIYRLVLAIIVVLILVV